MLFVIVNFCMTKTTLVLVWFPEWLEEILVLHGKNTKPKLKKNRKKQKTYLNIFFLGSDIQNHISIKLSINVKCKTPKLWSKDTSPHVYMTFGQNRSDTHHGNISV